MKPGSPTRRVREFSLASDVEGGGYGLPSRHVIYGPEGVGKTSLAAASPMPIFVMTRGETGLRSLATTDELRRARRTIPRWARGKNPSPRSGP
jgi:hypothetical protein